MSSIVTFYSYKGGVGRSMAIANIAYELTRKGKKVLIVDWDLEAPGIEKYFSCFRIDESPSGLLTMLMDCKNILYPDYSKYISTIHIDDSSQISLITSGRDADPTQYSCDLEKFDWEDLFENRNGGEFLERLRQEWLSNFDIVLIDSRTGLSDASNICTILMPDIIIPMFTANLQSLFGIRDILKNVQAARQRLPVDRMAPTILPIPCRFGTRVEFKESQEWLDRIADLLEDCFSDWLPEFIEPRYILEQLKIPQIDYFSFGEKLAVVEHGIIDPESLGHIYTKIADLLASDFVDIPSFVGNAYYDACRESYNKNPIHPRKKNISTIKDQKLDLLICSTKDAYEWSRELFIPAITEYLEAGLGYKPQIVADIFDTEFAGVDILLEKISRSKIFSLIYSYPNPDLNHFLSEMNFLLGKQAATVNRFYPICFSKSREGEQSPVIHLDHAIDLSEFPLIPTLKSTMLRSHFGLQIQQLANNIATTVRDYYLNESLYEDDAISYLGAKDLSAKYQKTEESQMNDDWKNRSKQTIFKEMKNFAARLSPENKAKILPMLLPNYLPGNRLLAIVLLQAKPDISYLDWLINHIGDAETPFIGLQACKAIFEISRHYRQKSGELILEKIKEAQEKLPLSRFGEQNMTLEAANTFIKLDSSHHTQPVISNN